MRKSSHIASLRQALLVAAVTTPVLAAELPSREAPITGPLQPGEASTAVVIGAGVEAWQSSSVRIELGATYRISANGTWQIGGLCNATGPDGLNPYTLLCLDGPGNPIPDVSHSALIGRVGHEGGPFAVGALRELSATEDGTLYLMVNDTRGWFFDNTGQVNVRVERRGP